MLRLIIMRVTSDAIEGNRVGTVFCKLNTDRKHIRPQPTHTHMYRTPRNKKKNMHETYERDDANFTLNTVRFSPLIRLQLEFLRAVLFLHQLSAKRRLMLLLLRRVGPLTVLILFHVMHSC